MHCLESSPNARDALARPPKCSIVPLSEPRSEDSSAASPTHSRSHQCADAHERTGVILSTGGHGIVRQRIRAANRLRCGAGKRPVLIERTADIPDAIQKVIEGNPSTMEPCVRASRPSWPKNSAGTHRRGTEGTAGVFLQRTAERCAGKLLLTPNWTVIRSAWASLRPRLHRWPDRSATRYAGAGGGSEWRW